MTAKRIRASANANSKPAPTKGRTPLARSESLSIDVALRDRQTRQCLWRKCSRSCPAGCETAESRSACALARRNVSASVIALRRSITDTSVWSDLALSSRGVGDRTDRIEECATARSPDVWPDRLPFCRSDAAGARKGKISRLLQMGPIAPANYELVRKCQKDLRTGLTQTGLPLSSNCHNTFGGPDETQSPLRSSGMRARFVSFTRLRWKCAAARDHRWPAGWYAVVGRHLFHRHGRIRASNGQGGR